jgi:hypothetical protein
MVLSRGTFALFYKTKTSSHEKANWLMPLGDLERVAFKSEQLRKYFPKSYTPRQMSDVILKLLDQWQKKRQRDKAR